jgi:ribosomal protein L27
MLGGAQTVFQLRGRSRRHGLLGATAQRLGGKASDPQRVDNCKVPLDQRGSTPRPDDCGDATRLPPERR